jgi:hypothetical protein
MSGAAHKKLKREYNGLVFDYNKLLDDYDRLLKVYGDEVLSNVQLVQERKRTRAIVEASERKIKDLTAEVLADLFVVGAQ